MTTIDRDWAIDWYCKSFPPSASGTRASELAAAKWHLHGDFTTPVAALKETALVHNLGRMRDYCAEHGIQLAPHGKTTMSPELIARQLEYGAWGLTAATAWQARVMLGFGVSRVIIANECIDPVGLRWIAEHLRDNPRAEVFVFVDSVASVEAMRAELSGKFPPVPVLVEVGVDGGRAGAREVHTAVEVGQTAAAAPELQLAGVGGFEGVLGGSQTPSVREPVRAFLGSMRQVAEELMRAGAFPPGRPVILTAGGSAHFDQVVDVFTASREEYLQPVEVVIRSGCYVTHDHAGYYDFSPFRGTGEKEFQPAVEVWARVLSTPEPGLAIIDAGKRDVSTDSAMPVVLGRLRDGRYEDMGWAVGDPATPVVDHVNDQHGYVHMAAGSDDVLRVGDLVALGIAHPCTTFDKWRVIPVVDDDYRVISAVRTFF